jgi:heterogeneous nuclear ribonucleoprotein F/H
MSFVKLRGLPWSCTEEDIIRFFSGISIANNSLNDQIEHAEAINGESFEENSRVRPAVYLIMNTEGRPSGEAFVELETEGDSQAALNRNNAKIGQRYIEGKFKSLKIKLFFK